MKHTPGPWHVSGGDIHDARNNASFFIQVYSDEDHEAADARLVAAAPELLASLKAIVAIADRKTIEFAAARAAIAKAEGET